MGEKGREKGKREKPMRDTFHIFFPTRRTSCV